MLSNVLARLGLAFVWKSYSPLAELQRIKCCAK